MKFLCQQCSLLNNNDNTANNKLDRITLWLNAANERGGHWHRLVKNIRGTNQNIGGKRWQKLINT